MPRVLPRQRPLLTAVAVAILGALVAALGFGAVAIVIVLIFGFLYPGLLFLFAWLARSRPVTIEGDTLFQRNSQGRHVARIDLKLPFVATFLFEDDHHAYYRVRQQKAVPQTRGSSPGRRPAGAPPTAAVAASRTAAWRIFVTTEGLQRPLLPTLASPREAPQAFHRILGSSGNIRRGDSRCHAAFLPQKTTGEREKGSHQRLLSLFLL